MTPPSALSQAFDATCSAWLGRWIDTILPGVHSPLSDLRLLQFAPSSPGGPKGHYFRVSCHLAVSEVRLPLPNFYNITIRIANVAARLAVLVLWLCDKLGSPASP